MLSRLVITFLPRNKRLLISWLQSPPAVILEPPKLKSATVSTVSPSSCHEVMGCHFLLRDLPDPGIKSMSLVSPTLAGGFFTTAAAAAAKSLQSCPTLHDPMDCSPPGSSVHGIFQARVLEWVAIIYP